MASIKKEALYSFMLVMLMLISPGCGEKDKVTPEKDKSVWIERWIKQGTMNVKRAGLATVATGNRIYAIGGGIYTKENTLEILKSVEYADVLDDGKLGEWKMTSSLNMPRIYLSSAIHGDYIYIMGGESLDRLYKGSVTEAHPALLDSIERAKIMPDGSLGEWTLEKERMYSSRRGGELFAHNGWLYAMGGYNGMFLNNVERAKINADGSIGKWIKEDATISDTRYISGYIKKDNRFYLLGGHLSNALRALDSVEMAEVMPDSSLSKWEATTPMYVRRFLNTATVVGDEIFAIAGHNTINMSSTERATILEDGSLAKWQPDTPLDIPRRAASAAAWNDFIYVLGGMIGPMGKSESIDVVEFANVGPGKKVGNRVKTESEDYKSYNAWKNSVSFDSKNFVIHGYESLNKESFHVALFDAEEAIKAYPDNYIAYNLEGSTYHAMGNSDKAVEMLNKSLSIKENFSALIGLGNISFNKGELSEAESYYERASKADQSSLLAHENLGSVYMRMEDYDRAIEKFQWILGKTPDSDYAKEMLAESEKSKKGAKEDKPAHH